MRLNRPIRNLRREADVTGQTVLGLGAMKDVTMPRPGNDSGLRVDGAIPQEVAYMDPHLKDIHSQTGQR